MMYVLPLLLACDMFEGGDPRDDDDDSNGREVRSLNLLYPPDPTFGAWRDPRLEGCVLTITWETGSSTWEYDDRGRLTAYEGSTDEDDGTLSVGSGTMSWTDDDCLELHTYVRADSEGSTTNEYVRSCDDQGNTEAYEHLVDGELQREETRTNTYDDDGWLISARSEFNEPVDDDRGIIHLSVEYDDGWISEIVNAFATEDDDPQWSETTTYRTRGDVLERREQVICMDVGNEECEDDEFEEYTFNGNDEAIAGEGFSRVLDLQIGGNIDIESEATWTGTIVPSEDGWPAEATFITDDEDPVHQEYSVECDGGGGF